MDGEFINKVAESGIITIDLEEFFPKDEIVVFDLKDYLFMELILKEKDFREALKSLDTSKYENKNVAVLCSADAIIPMWAYMLVASSIQPVAKSVFFGSREQAAQHLLIRNIEAIDPAKYDNQRLVIKGCGEIKIPEAAYVSITQKLRPVAKSIMYGEPCSTVPIYKRPKDSN